MISTLIGIVFVALGLIGLIHWPKDFVVVVRGSAPLILLFGGVVALITGFSSLQGPGRDDKNRK